MDISELLLSLESNVEVYNLEMLILIYLNK